MPISHSRSSSLPLLVLVITISCLGTSSLAFVLVPSNSLNAVALSTTDVSLVTRQAISPRRPSQSRYSQRKVGGYTNKKEGYNNYNDDNNDDNNNNKDDRFVKRQFEDYDKDFELDDDDDNYFGMDFNDDDDDNNQELLFDVYNENKPDNFGAHFFSRKPLEDPSFCLSQPNTASAENLHEQLCRGAGITRPSRIQSLAWPVLLQGKHAIVADQTGTGKTLAYLIPLLQRALAAPPTSPKLNGAPQILILAPTAELADQVRAVCDKLSTHTPFSTMVVTATGKYSTSIRDQIRRLQRQPVDVLISTPGRLSTIVRTRNAGLDLSSRLQALVLDEVDILMDDTSHHHDNEPNIVLDDDNKHTTNPNNSDNDTFGSQLRTIGQAMKDRVEQTQFVFVTATLPDRIVQAVTREFPGVTQIRGPGLHRVAPSLTERLVDVSVPPQENRNSKLSLQTKAVELLKTLRLTRCRRTLIFCNTVQSCRAVENLVQRRDRKRQKYNVRAYHNAMAPQARNFNLDIFCRAGQQPPSQSRDDSSSSNRKTPTTPKDVDYILVCTDRAARGVDFGAAPVDHVILFDFPRDPAEYVRRVGRTARAGRGGTCTVFAYGWQLPIARSVMGQSTTVVSSKATTDVNANNNDDNDDSDDAVEYRGGVQGRQQRKRKQRGNGGGKSSASSSSPNNSNSNTRDAAVKDKIEGSKLWKR